MAGLLTSIKKQRNLAFLAFAIFLLAVMALVESRTGINKVVPSDVIQDVKHTLIGFILLGFLADLLLRTTVSESITNTIGALFTSDRSVFSKLHEKTRSAIVQNVLFASLPEEIAQSVYHDMIKDYLEGEREYRKSFSYRIRFADRYAKVYGGQSENVKDVIGKLNSRVDRYFWVHQDMSYSQHAFSGGNRAGDLKINFALSNEQLERFVHDEGVFFREVLQLDADTSEALRRCSNEELREFVEEVLEFEISYADNVEHLKYQVEWAFDVEGEPFVALIAKPSSDQRGTGCRIGFSYPHKRVSNYFLVTMPKPMDKGARILFEGAPSMKSLSELIFLPNDTYKVDKTPPSGNRGKSITLQTLRWTFPTSGVVFLWEV